MTSIKTNLDHVELILKYADVYNIDNPVDHNIRHYTDINKIVNIMNRSFNDKRYITHIADITRLIDYFRNKKGFIFNFEKDFLNNDYFSGTTLVITKSHKDNPECFNILSYGIKYQFYIGNYAGAFYKNRILRKGGENGKT